MPAELCELPLANADGVAIVDADLAHLARYTWRLDHKGYVYRNDSRIPEGKTWRERKATHVLLHRFVLGLAVGDGKQADHKNRDRLDNRRANLRVVENAQNCQNLGARAGRFRGVWQHPNGRWYASAKLNYRSIHLGTYGAEVDAAKAAEAWRRVHMPHSQPDERLQDLPVCRCRDCAAVPA